MTLGSGGSTTSLSFGGSQTLGVGGSVLLEDRPVERGESGGWQDADHPRQGSPSRVHRDAERQWWRGAKWGRRVPGRVGQPGIDQYREWWRHGDGEKQQRGVDNTGTLKANGGTLTLGGAWDSSVARGDSTGAAGEPAQHRRHDGADQDPDQHRRHAGAGRADDRVDPAVPRDGVWQDGDGGERRGADGGHVRQRDVERCDAEDTNLSVANGTTSVLNRLTINTGQAVTLGSGDRRRRCRSAAARRWGWWVELFEDRPRERGESGGWQDADHQEQDHRQESERQCGGGRWGRRVPGRGWSTRD